MPVAALRSRSGLLLFRTVEIAANLATIVVAVLISTVLVKNHLLKASAVPLRPALAVTADSATSGTDLGKRITGVNWSRNGQTLVLVLSTRCHFCTESAPFFRQIRESVGTKVTLIGVLPEPTVAAESYLSRESVHLDEVRQMPLNQIGVDGTPTMLLVNSRGIVTQTWVGKLAPDAQAEALKTILGSSSAAASKPGIILDARRRSPEGHAQGASDHGI